MRLVIASLLFLVIFVWAPLSKCLAATVTCVVKEVQGSTLILENCDERLAKEFQKGSKVKVKQQKKED